ncbi:hypothetical protein GCM10007276_11980 [Agaricicola taiwanensis]|uniref:Uncharacterized protein n=1 Tax=Agaricicola taiwanensis TaxID=591372 RepID=A0A8J2VLG0_9RHOB|nr:hypothetical protein [Agaricicola taiwanensis]GGE36108.1 hypothetical protein GCM10007276_11980 [Agaricicola taiwanensis]
MTQTGYFVLKVITACPPSPGEMPEFIESNKEVLSSLLQDEKRVVWDAMNGRRG